MTLIEEIHYPLLRSLTLDELCERYRKALRIYVKSNKIHKSFPSVMYGQMMAYAEYLSAIWRELCRRADDELEVELLEAVYKGLAQ